jgi:hypothetical protein
MLLRKHTSRQTDNPMKLKRSFSLSFPMDERMWWTLNTSILPKMVFRLVIDFPKISHASGVQGTKAISSGDCTMIDTCRFLGPGTRLIILRCSGRRKKVVEDRRRLPVYIYQSLAQLGHVMLSLLINFVNSFMHDVIEVF